jgi:hypothetical protein
LLGDRLREQREREAAYRKFILELYHATPVSGHVWLHGVKAGRMVHVGAVDAPVTRADVNAIAAEVWKAAGKGANSPEKAVEQGDVHFFELGALKVESKIKKRELTLTQFHHPARRRARRSAQRHQALEPDGRLLGRRLGLQR